MALEDQILCKEFQDEAGEKYEKITSHLSALQQLGGRVARDVKWWWSDRLQKVHCMIQSQVNNECAY